MKLLMCFLWYFAVSSIAFSQINGSENELQNFVIKRVAETILLENEEMNQYRVKLDGLLQTCQDYFVLGVPDSLITGDCKEEHYYSDCILALCGVSLFFHHPTYTFSLVRFEIKANSKYTLQFNLLEEPLDPNDLGEIKTLFHYTIIAKLTNENEVIVESINKYE